MAEVQYPNGTSASTTYDTAARVTEVQNRHNTSAEVSTFTYQYDLNGNRIEQTEAHGGLATETTTYTFDEADRLLSVAYPEKTTTYTYDQAGNRLSEEDIDPNDQLLSQKAFTYDDRNRLLSVDNTVDPTASVTCTYDANGNQTGRLTASGDATTFTYDVRDRLAEITVGDISLGQYTYNDQGLRVQKNTIESGQEQYTYDQQSVLQRTGSNSNITKYDYGPSRLLSVTSDTTGRAYYLFDALGSITDLTTPQGSVLARYKWDAWGNPRETIETEANPFGFTGHEHDTETGLIYAKARFYDPETGRFLSEDPVFGSLESPPSLHRYLYGFQNPTVYVDPDGREAREVPSGYDNFVEAAFILVGGSRGNSRFISRSELFSALVGNLDDSSDEIIDVGLQQPTHPGVPLQDQLDAAAIGVAAAPPKVLAHATRLASAIDTFSDLKYDDEEGAKARERAGLFMQELLLGVAAFEENPDEIAVDFVTELGEDAFETGKAVLGGDRRTIANVSRSTTVFVIELEAGGFVAGEGSTLARLGRMALNRAEREAVVEIVDDVTEVQLARQTDKVGSVPQGTMVRGRFGVVKRSAEKVNSTFPSHYLPPYRPGTQVIEFTSSVDDVFVRVHGARNKARSWMIREDAIQGLSAQQIKSKYALPNLPEFISEVYVPSGTRIRRGKVNPGFDGAGRAVQYQLLERLPETAFKKTKRLQ